VINNIIININYPQAGCSCMPTSAKLIIITWCYYNKYADGSSVFYDILSESPYLCWRYCVGSKKNGSI